MIIFITHTMAQRRAYAAACVSLRLAQRHSGLNEVGFGPHHALVIAPSTIH